MPNLNSNSNGLIEPYTDSCLLSMQCTVLNEKLDSLLQALNTEAQAMSPPPLTTPPIVEEELEEEELEEEDLSEESLTELKEKMEENVTEKDSPHKLFRPREQLMLRANSLKKAVRQIIEQAEKSNNDKDDYNILMNDLLAFFLFVPLLHSGSVYLGFVKFIWCKYSY